MLLNDGFLFVSLQFYEKSLPLQCVFHSIRFKVNKGWSKALLLFLCLYFCVVETFHIFVLSNGKSMKSFFIGLIVSLVGMQLVAQEREYVIVVHGGAGAMAGLENDQEKAAQYYAALDSALTIGDARQ